MFVYLNNTRLFTQTELIIKYLLIWKKNIFLRTFWRKLTLNPLFPHCNINKIQNKKFKLFP